MKNLLCVDIQPAYENFINFNIYEWVKFLNQQKNRILFLYNGPDLGYEDEDEIKNWLIDRGLKENKLDNIIFFEKGYAFFRDWLDTHGYNSSFQELFNYMIANNINDSRDVPEEDFNDEIKSFLETGNSIYIPEVLKIIKDFANSYSVCGGGENQCLLEVKIILDTLHKKYSMLNKFIY